MDSWDLLQENIRFYQQVMLEAEALLAEYQLETKSFLLLSMLETVNYPAMLAQALLLPKSTVTFLIKKLEAAGYIQRQIVLNDLRSFKIILTSSGVEVLQIAKMMMVNTLDRQFQKLTAEELQQYTTLLLKLNTNHK